MALMKEKDREVANGQDVLSYVVDALREGIASNDLPPGTKLREVELSQSLGVSRQSIRDAFTVLEVKGLVTRIRNRGAYVTKYDYQDVMDIYDLREALTALTYQLAARRAPEGAWDEMVELFGESMDGVIEAKDLKAFSHAIFRLDELAANYANNRFLDPVLEPITDRTQVLSRRIMLLPDRLEIGVDLNRRILQALIARDEEAVRQIFGEMMDISRNYLTKYKEILF